MNQRKRSAGKKQQFARLVEINVEKASRLSSGIPGLTSWLTFGLTVH